MGSHIILFGWNRSIPGREKLSAGHFEEFLKYLAGLQQDATIQGFEVVFIDAHGGDMNGFLKPKVRLLANPLPFEGGCIVLRPGYWPEIDRAALRAHETRSERYAPMAVA